MKATQKLVYVILSVPVLVTFTRIADIAIVAEFLHVLILDTQHVHNLLVAVNTRRLFWKIIVT